MLEGWAVTETRKQKTTSLFQITLSPGGICTSGGVDGIRVTHDSDGTIRRSAAAPGASSYDSKFLDLIAGLNPSSNKMPIGATEAFDGSLSITLSTERRPNRADLAGLDGKQTRQIFQAWWANHDANTPIAPWWKTPFHSDSKVNRAIRARMRARSERKHEGGER
jgi:hypothetical protein